MPASQVSESNELDPVRVCALLSSESLQLLKPLCKWVMPIAGANLNWRENHAVQTPKETRQTFKPENSESSFGAD